MNEMLQKRGVVESENIDILKGNGKKPDILSVLLGSDNEIGIMWRQSFYLRNNLQNP
jgi:hypothetical protein